MQSQVHEKQKGKDEVRDCLAKVIEQIIELEAKVSAHDANQSESLERQLNAYIAGLEKLYDNGKQGLLVDSEGEPIDVPVELVQYIDEGGNPDDFMRQTMMAMLEASQSRKGKLDVMQKLKMEAFQ
eukprot:jgi/Picsp_1/1470/NSC_04948-R1_mediator of rna polymerase ii transcription subunit 10